MTKEFVGNCGLIFDQCPFVKTEDAYRCPNCKSDTFLIVFEGFGAFMDGIVAIECKCGLKTTFDWSKAKK